MKLDYNESVIANAQIAILLIRRYVLFNDTKFASDHVRESKQY